MKYFGIKYALSGGRIHEFEGSPSATDEEFIYDGRGVWAPQYRIGKTAFMDRGDAVAAAKAMRDKKVKSLQAQIAKLQAMDFSA